MYMESTSQRGLGDRSDSSPPRERKLRQSKSTGILHTVARKVSFKTLRRFGGHASTDETEHPSLDARDRSNPAFIPPASSLPRGRLASLWRPGRPNLEAVPPLPRPLPDSEDQLFKINMIFDPQEMEGIVNRSALYHEGNDGGSPGGSDFYSSPSLESSEHSDPRLPTPKLFNSFVLTPNGPGIRSPDPVGPTDTSGMYLSLSRDYDVSEGWALASQPRRESFSGEYPIPESWAVTPAVKSGRDPDQDSTSDDGRTGNMADLPRWNIRVCGPDNNEHILRVTANDTVASLTPQLKREKHELYLKERGRERILKQTERPAKILRRALQQAGYDENDRLGGTTIPGAPFLLKFVYRSQVLGPTDEELSFNNFVYVNLMGRSLSNIPVACHQHADSIVSLRLSRNPMIDIPKDFVESCTALRELYLSNMYIKRVPHTLQHATTLTLLDLSSNRIVSLDEAHLDELPCLSTLYLQNNRLETLPRTFARLCGLANLNISNNKFRIFPVVVTKLANLSSLDISFNSISNLPYEIGRLMNLAEFVIAGNHISALPMEFSSLTRLRELDCRRNQIADLAVACLLPALEILKADHNNLHTLAITLGPSLKALHVSHNDITELQLPIGHSPSTVHFALTCLDLSNSKLSVLDDGTVAQLLSLRSLKLDRNSFHTLPDSLGELKWLETLSCADNALNELPESVGRLQKLETLDVHYNSLKALPVALWNCASLSRLNVTSNLLEVWHDPPPFVPDIDGPPPALPSATLLPSPTFAPRRPSVSTKPDIPPLAHSLEMLYLGENALTDEMLHPLMQLKELRVLNLSVNDIQELPPNFFRNLTNLEEVYLSGNRLTHIPSEDLPKLHRLSTLFLNGNHLQHLPHELGKVKSLTLLDVGNNLLKYNINNLDYDWNWNFNKNLVYLNLSGNKQLQIKSDVSNHRHSIASVNRQSLSGFSGLTRLRVLGLMDVTITTTGRSTGSDIPDESDDRRVRTSSSLVNGLSYSIADTLGKNAHPLMMDLVHEFRGIKKDTVFAMFGRAQPANQAAANTCNSLAKFLKDNFIRVFITQLSSLEPRRKEGVPDALRRSFLRLNQDYHDSLFSQGVRKMSSVGGADASTSLLHNGASGIVVYIVNKTMYVANVGNALAIVSRSGIAHPVSRKHTPYDRAETTRIRDAEGWLSPSGLVNDELDISRSFGFFHLMPVVNARPDVCEYKLSSMDEWVIIANRGLWDYVDYQTAVDIVQKTEPTEAAERLRDLAISYGAEGSTMVMVVCLANLFKDKSAMAPAAVDRRSRRRGVGDEVPPPVGHVAIVFTDIKGSTHLWEATPSGMITAIHLHNSLLRRYLRFCGGYEVRTEGDSFMCSFPTVLAAVWWCLTIQLQLLRVAWPQDILQCPDGKEVYDQQDRLIYRGLSVRIGIHCGSPLCQTDPVTNRMDYFGLMVTRAARIASVATGGQTLFSADVMSEINARVFGSEPTTDSQPKEAVEVIQQMEPVVVPVGEVKLKGLEASEMLFFVLPAALIGRKNHKDTVVVKPTLPAVVSPRVPAPALSPTTASGPQLDIVAQVRDLTMLCARLETASAGRQPGQSLSDEPDKSSMFNEDSNALLPPDTDMSNAQLSATLNSLKVRMENIEGVLQNRPRIVAPPLATKDAIVSALRNLDERTLEEVWSMLHPT
ncbi:hypothetical protein B0H19DRAFT_1129846 [Mycena capillaripes]|nr:hypothetical protein B0H19DRAFT_1129846 [Mycena capillaripes]